MAGLRKERILEELKRWRREKSLKERVEPYFIFSNAVLEATVEADPHSKEDMLGIKGWGAKKAEKYGDEVLALILGQGAEAAAEEGVLTVAQFIGRLNDSLSLLDLVKIKGEISDVGGREGFSFFNLKDSVNGGEDPSIIQCFLGRRFYDNLSHLIENGMEAIITGYPRVYRSGYLRLEIVNVEPVGEGALQKAFEALKKKLEAKGYFSEERKRPIPEFIKRVGLITSDAGAAITDFRKNLGRHGFNVYLVDVRVEGIYAEESITSAIGFLNKTMPQLDVLVLIRGGGGLESLKAFNSERVAEAVLLSRLPVVAGIGHERDETIAGLTVDKNLSTPTAVANFLRTQREELLSRVENLSRSLERLMDRRLENSRLRLESKLALELSRGFGWIFAEFKVMEHSLAKAAYAYESGFETVKRKIALLFEGCANILERRLENDLGVVALAEAGIVSLNPEALLKKGYSLAYAGGKIIRSIREVNLGEKIHLRLADGRLSTRVEEKENQSI